MKSSTKTCRNACKLYGRHVKQNKFDKSKVQFFSIAIFAFLYNNNNNCWIHTRAYIINFPTLLIKTNIYIFKPHTVAKILFLPVTKRCLTLLSFTAGLRKGHEVEASKLIDFKFDFFLNLYINIHTYHYLISQLKLFKFWNTNWETCVLRKKSVSFFILTQKCQPCWKSPVKFWWWI